MMYKHASSKLDDIASLKDNWNANGASAFSKELIAAAKEMLAVLPVEPEIFPTTNDSLQFEYDKVDGSILQFELFEDGTLAMFTMNLHGPKGNGVTHYVDIQEAVESIERFHTRAQ